MLNRVKGAPPFERRDGFERSRARLPPNDVKRDVLFQVGRAQTTVEAGRERRFASYKKISFHHTAKTRRRQPRAGRNNATFLAKILAFSTKPSVSVVFSLKIAPGRPTSDARTSRTTLRRPKSTVESRAFADGSLQQNDNITKNVILSSSKRSFRRDFFIFRKSPRATLKITSFSQPFQRSIFPNFANLLIFAQPPAPSKTLIFAFLFYFFLCSISR